MSRYRLVNYNLETSTKDSLIHELDGPKLACYFVKTKKKKKTHKYI